MKKFIIWILFDCVILFFVQCIQKNTNNSQVVSSVFNEEPAFQTIRVDSLNAGLIIYYPQTTHFGLVCGEMPDTNISNISFVCAAAFTGKKLGTFRHDNIAGDHVSAGQRYHGYSCIRNTGAFVSYNSKWKFLYQNYSHELDSAANNDGMGFAQEMMIHKSRIVKHTRPDGEINLYRALCDINGELAIADSRDKISFGTFIELLLRSGANEALYMDMGGWKQSWYREYYDKGPQIIYPVANNYGTNWFTVYVYD